MFLTILINDLKRKKVMNFILLLFIILSTTFLSGSVSSLLTVTNAIDYFGEVTHVTDFFVITNKDDELDQWAAENQYINDFESVDVLMFTSDMYLEDKKIDLGERTLITLPNNRYNIILNRKDEEIYSVNKGEIIINNAVAMSNGIDKGDILTCQYNGLDMKFVVADICKDMVFGSTSMGAPRVFVSREDFDLMARQEDVRVYSFYSILTDDLESLQNEFNSSGFTVQTSVTKELLDQVFILDIMVAAILCIVSVILILIAFLVLRFMIVFTVQEDYKEIGIMKAIGMNNFSIKQIYIIKYFFVATIGVLIGVFLGIPFSEMMVQSVENNMVLAKASSNFKWNVLCGAIIFVLVIAFSWFCVGKLKKYSVMQSIRLGAITDNMKGKVVMALNKKKTFPMLLFMAINDILSNVKRYVLLIFVFIMGSLLVILPINAANTLGDKSLIGLFGMNQSDVFVNDHNFTSYTVSQDKQVLQDAIDNLEKIYADAGVDVKFTADCWYFVFLYSNDINTGVAISGIQSFNNILEPDYLLSEGKYPVEENEIAIADTVMEELGIQVGDNVHLILNGEEKEFNVSGSMTSMMNMGYSVRFSQAIELNFSMITSMMDFQGKFEKGTDIENAIDIMKDVTPEYRILNCKDYAGTLVGSITQSLNVLKLFIVILVLCINCLITALMVKTFLTKDVGEIALLKNLGFTNSSIRIIQMLRIMIVLLVAILLSIPLSIPLNAITNDMTFGAMGASNIKSVVVPLEVFVLYPCILLVGTSVAALLSTGGIKKICFRNIGNIE